MAVTRADGFARHDEPDRTTEALPIERLLVLAHHAPSSCPVRTRYPRTLQVGSNTHLAEFAHRRACLSGERLELLFPFERTSQRSGVGACVGQLQASVRATGAQLAPASVERQQQRCNRSYPCASTLSSSCGAVAHALLLSAGIRSPRATRLARPYVESVDDTLERVSAQGGAPVEAPYAEGDLRVATFRDPAGNVIGVWQRGSHG
jgi:hypothetical protein